MYAVSRSRIRTPSLLLLGSLQPHAQHLHHLTSSTLLHHLTSPSSSSCSLSSSTHPGEEPISPGSISLSVSPSSPAPPRTAPSSTAGLRNSNNNIPKGRSPGVRSLSRHITRRMALLQVTMCRSGKPEDGPLLSKMLRWNKL